ncbi:hypothetical protein VTN00DRAFT_12 [Thermoascus crustaceus]|uniref:uncharacterized protein n=1 Tax=Thermoascus crustaceus TaxID=5088 RepID=UPI0037421ED0
MPGSFLFNSPVPPKLDLAGAPSQLFQLPHSPSASSSLSRSLSRKRFRFDSQEKERYGWDTDGHRRESDWDNLLNEKSASPAPLVRTDYRLREDQDTITLGLGQATRDAAELDYRPNRYRDAAARDAMSLDASVDSLPSANTPSRKRPRRTSDIGVEEGDEDGDGDGEKSTTASTTTPASSWGRAVFNVVGKVWDFCWSGAFRGFYAGGGRGYMMRPDAPPTPDQSQNQSPSQSVWQSASKPAGVDQDGVFAPRVRDITPIPGQFPEDQDRDSNMNTNSDLRNSWVLVHHDDENRETSPSAAYAARRVPRRTTAATFRRRSAVPPRLGNKRPVFSTARPTNPTPPKHQRSSSASSEAQRYAAKVRRLEREEDASIRRLNEQLKAMIKEGREALGTRVEIESMDLEDYE